MKTLYEKFIASWLTVEIARLMFALCAGIFAAIILYQVLKLIHRRYLRSKEAAMWRRMMNRGTRLKVFTKNKSIVLSYWLWILRIKPFQYMWNKGASILKINMWAMRDMQGKMHLWRLNSELNFEIIF